MKNYIYLLSLFLLFFSCKENQKETKSTTLSSAIEKAAKNTSENQQDTQDSDKAFYKALKKKTPLTEDQLIAALPEHINGNKILGDYARQASLQEASGAYGSFDSPENTYTFWIKDGAGSKSIVKSLLLKVFFTAMK